MRLRVRPTLLLAAFGLLLLLPKESQAVPQFSRRYNIKCSACHTIAPVLNEQGWMFKRLGFHLPPALEDGQVAALISDLVKKEPEWKLTNNVSIAVADFSYSSERTTAVGTPPNSTSAFQVAAWNNYFGGWIPDTNFFYFAEFDIVTGGVTSPALMNANFGYSGGNARSSWYIDGGREHLQVGEGTRAAQIYSLLPNSPLLFENPSPTTFVIDQSPVGIDVSYTWASSSYKRVFAATAKVTNGDNADGTEITGPSNRNSKDVWLDLDYWYAPESGITFLDYYGKKDQANTDPLGNQFTFHPSIRRQGIFANYMYDNKLDFTAGYLHSHDDWEFAAGGPSGTFLGNDYYVALDYYIVRGFAISGRFDRLNQQITGTGGVGEQNMHDWTIGASKTLTPSGNIVGRIAYSYQSGSDPVAAIKATDKLVQADIAFNF
jgi:hypothetical protein